MSSGLFIAPERNVSGFIFEFSALIPHIASTKSSDKVTSSFFTDFSDLCSARTLFMSFEKLATSFFKFFLKFLFYKILCDASLEIRSTK